ncbi:hypothetical protein PAEAM_44120 [Paenibacillus sp. GM1FR]|uniref:hypothetical protein n=1 Tax=Paenibacillus sp. GM1FR TaxID=2059267 RepID=UPI000C27442B|nr:hypothetical protein [Paenibacillus sp. GM1FR]PJN53209.1 hypothetical protein PAEAM_44120 [Paenibacillus sp. GM1FR]
MIIINPIGNNIEKMLLHYEKNGHLTLQASLISNRSVVYRLQDYCLKVYASRARLDGEMESEALRALQSNPYAPKLYAYSPGEYTLTEWIEAFKLKEYRVTYGHIPPNLIYDMFTTELQQIHAGYWDWDVIRYENLHWTKTGHVKRMNFWLCEPVNSRRENLYNQVIRRIDNIYNGDCTEMEAMKQYFYRHQLTSLEIEQAFSDFRSQRPRLAIAQ